VTSVAAGGRLPAQITVTAGPSGRMVAVHGVLDAAAIAAAAEHVAAAPTTESLVVDLRDTVLAPPDQVLRLLAGLRHLGRDRPIVVVCDRLSGRRLLRRTCQELMVVLLNDLPTPPRSSARP
jgi:hypothetical protein